MSDVALSEPVLETYDPKWKIRLDEIHQKQESNRAAGISDPKLHEQLLEAFHSQFRTASDYLAWVTERLGEKAASERKVLVLENLPKDSTVERINEWQRAAYQMLDEQDYISLPIGSLPSGFFEEPLADNAERKSFFLNYEGFHGFSSHARCTLEKTANGAHVCLHHMKSSTGTSPTNMIEKLATNIREIFLPDLKPDQITFFIHVPTNVAGHTGESFSRVDMKWDGKEYTQPRWIHIDAVPSAIRTAEAAPYDEAPFPEADRSSVSPPELTLAQRLLRMFR